MKLFVCNHAGNCSRKSHCTHAKPHEHRDDCCEAECYDVLVDCIPVKSPQSYSPFEDKPEYHESFA